MATQVDFNEQDWFLISSTPSLVGTAVAMAGNSGMIGTLQEMMASVKGMMEANQAYPHNALIQAIVAQPQDREEAKARAERYQQMAMEKMNEANIRSPQALAAQALGDFSNAMGLIASRGNHQEVTEYREWVLSVAKKVPEAAKEGGFLGFGGQQVSSEEVALLGQLEGVTAAEVAVVEPVSAESSSYETAPTESAPAETTDSADGFQLDSILGDFDQP